MKAPGVVERMMLVPAATGRPHVSVIIVNYFAGEGLRDCLCSVLKQAGQVVVVDNSASEPDDDTLDILRAEFSGDPKLVLLPQLSNLGFAAACNVGIAASTGQWLLFLNPDCVLADDAISKLVMAMQAHPEAGMAGGLLLNSDGSEQAGGRRAVPTPWRSFVRGFGFTRFEHRYPRLFAGYELHGDPLPMTAEPVEAISGACMLVRHVALADVGLLDDGYFMHCEDLDWCMRFRQAGWDVLFVPDAKVVHEKGACSRSRPLFVEWHKHKGMIRFYRRHFSHQYPGVLMVLVVVGVWLRFFAILARQVLRRKLFNFGRLREAF